MPNYDNLIKNCQKDAKEALKKDPPEYADLLAIYNRFFIHEENYLQHYLGRDEAKASRYAIYRALYLDDQINRLENARTESETLFVDDPEKEQKAKADFTKSVKDKLKSIVDGSFFENMISFSHEAENSDLKRSAMKKIGRYYDNNTFHEPGLISARTILEDVIGNAAHDNTNPMYGKVPAKTKKAVARPEIFAKESVEMISGIINRLKQGQDGVHNGSKEYDNIITAAEALEKKTKELYKLSRYGGEVTEKKFKELYKLESELGNHIAIYTQKKEREYNNNGGHHRNENSRMRVELVKGISTDFLHMFDKNSELYADHYLNYLRELNLKKLQKADNTDKDLENIFKKDFYFRLLEREFGPEKDEDGNLKKEDISRTNARKKLLAEKLAQTDSAYSSGLSKFTDELAKYENAPDFASFVSGIKDDLAGNMKWRELFLRIETGLIIPDEMHLDLFSNVKGTDFPYITDQKDSLTELAKTIPDRAPRKDRMYEIVNSLTAAQKGVWGNTSEFDGIVKDANQIRLDERRINYNKQLSLNDKADAEALFERKSRLIERMQAYVIRKYSEKGEREYRGSSEKANSKKRREAMEKNILLLREELKDISENHLPEKTVKPDIIYKIKAKLASTPGFMTNINPGTIPPDTYGADDYINLSHILNRSNDTDNIALLNNAPDNAAEFENTLREQVELATALLNASTFNGSLALDLNTSVRDRKTAQNLSDTLAKCAIPLVDRIFSDIDEYRSRCVTGAGDEMKDGFIPGTETEKALFKLKKAIQNNGAPLLIDNDGESIGLKWEKYMDKNFNLRPSEKIRGISKNFFKKPVNPFAPEELEFDPNEFENDAAFYNQAADADPDEEFDLPDTAFGNTEELEIKEKPGIGNIKALTGKALDLGLIKNGPDDAYVTRGTDKIIEENELDNLNNEFAKADKKVLKANDLDKILKGIEKVAANELNKIAAQLNPEAAPSSPPDFKELTNCIYRTAYINSLKNDRDFVSGKKKLTEDLLKKELDVFVNELRDSPFEKVLKSTLFDMYSPADPFVDNTNWSEKKDAMDEAQDNYRRKLYNLKGKENMNTSLMVALSAFTGDRLIKETLLHGKLLSNTANYCSNTILDIYNKKYETKKENLLYLMRQTIDEYEEHTDSIDFLVKASKKGLLNKLGFENNFYKNTSKLASLKTDANDNVSSLRKRCDLLDPPEEAVQADQKKIIKKK